MGGGGGHTHTWSHSKQNINHHIQSPQGLTWLSGFISDMLHVCVRAHMGVFHCVILYASLSTQIFHTPWRVRKCSAWEEFLSYLIYSWKAHLVSCCLFLHISPSPFSPLWLCPDKHLPLLPSYIYLYFLSSLSPLLPCLVRILPTCLLLAKHNQLWKLLTSNALNEADTRVTRDL